MDKMKLIYSKEYEFLWKEKILNKNIMFLCMGGSYSYGTNIETSDIDIRGAYKTSVRNLLGLDLYNRENYVDNNTDTTLYDLRVLFKLLINNNPNTIEILGCRDEDYLYMTESGKMLIDNKDLFLSQRAIKSFGGYATAQLRRLTNALARDAYSVSDKEKHILGSCESMLNNFYYNHPDIPREAIELYIKDDEMKVNLNLKEIPLRKICSCANELDTVVKNYEKLNKRNKKKDELHLNKHAMHLIRLYLMGIDILEGRGINTYRENDIPLLMSIRNGKFLKDDGTFSTDFFDLLDEITKKFEYAKTHTDLPKYPRYEELDELLYEINSKNEI